MTAWWYWTLFLVVAAAVLAGPWICSRLEERADERDRELWRAMGGGRW